MTVLVLGGTGFIGAPLMRALAGRGAAAIAVHRGVRKAAEGVETVALDRTDTAGLTRLVRERQVEKVIDLIAFTEADTAPVLEALAGEVGRYVLASSADVYRNYGGLQRRETAEPILDLLTEDAPLRVSRHPYRQTPARAADDPERWRDDYDKIPLEARALASAGFAATVLRLPMVYGPGDRQRRFSWLIRPMAKGRPAILIDEAWARWRTSYGFVDDVAGAIACAALHPDAAGGTFNIGPTDTPDHLRWVERFAKEMDWRGEVQFAPSGTGAMADVLKALDLHFPLALDTSLIRARLGFSDSTALDDALRRTIEDELTRV